MPPPDEKIARKLTDLRAQFRKKKQGSAAAAATAAAALVVSSGSSGDGVGGLAEDHATAVSSFSATASGGALILEQHEQRDRKIEQMVKRWARDVVLPGIVGPKRVFVMSPMLRLQFLQTVQDKPLRDWLPPRYRDGHSQASKDFERHVLAVVDEVAASTEDSGP
mmetsp:Transcript_29594/g.95416  ORF Transcript_29594/g.95416 Transcript_29594/m.95416 type:complete len:165 (+) Transcript_29594:315-809(+)